MRPVLVIQNNAGNRHARKRKGPPRRKRANPKTTYCELAIRIPDEYQAVMGRKKVAKTVYALNKKDDLRAQVRDFEDEQNAKLEVLLGRVQTKGPPSSSLTEESPLISTSRLRGTRPYALRHTFVALYLAYGENIKTISVILGHATPSHTLDIYVGYIPSTCAELSNRCKGRVEAVAA